jgi:hypothetical protein
MTPGISCLRCENDFKDVELYENFGELGGKKMEKLGI